MSGTEADSYLDQVYNAKNERDLQKIYDQWADEYDLDVQKFGYRIPAVLMGLFCRYVPTDTGPILDAGAGTGILGESLATLGYDSLCALDLSCGMLERAQEKAVYSSCCQAALGAELPITDAKYSAVISGGTFTEGHAPASSFEELLRITKTGGHLIFSVLENVYDHGGFKDTQDQLEHDKCWELIDQTPRFMSLPLESAELRNLAFVYRKL